MGRPVLAFLIAPLWVTLFVGGAEVFMGPSVGEAAMMAAYFTFLTYLGTLVVGVPTYLVMRRRQLSSLWAGTVLGAVLAGSIWGVVLFVVGLWLLGVVRMGLPPFYLWHSEHSLLLLLVLAVTGTLGMLVGTTAWLIARPRVSRDRALAQASER